MASTGFVFDPAQFPNEIQTAAHETDVIELLQRIAHSNVDVSHDGDLAHGMQVLQQTVFSIQTPGGGVFDDAKLVEDFQGAAHNLLNVSGFLSRLHTEGIDFSFDPQVAQALDAIASEVAEQ